MGAKHSQQAMMPQQPTTHPLLSSGCTAKTFSDREYNYKLVIVGDTYTGRTCCLRRFTGIETFSEIFATMGADFMVRHITLNDIRIRLLPLISGTSVVGASKCITKGTSGTSGTHTSI